MTRPTGSALLPRFRAWLVAEREPGPARRIRLVLIALSVIAIGVFDASTGRTYLFSVFYLVPVGIGTIYGSTPFGCLLAFESAFTSVVVDRVGFQIVDVAAGVWNGTSRFASYALVVYLLGSLRRLALDLTEENTRTMAFLDTAAHQLRTPIAGVIASAEAITAATDPAGREESTANLVEATARLGRLVTSLLQLSRFTQPRRLGVAPIDLSALCASACAAARAASPTADIALHAPDHAVITTNGDAVYEAVSNLLDNAVRHAERSIVVEVTLGPVHATVDVIDDGPGVAPSDQELVFDRFVSLDRRGGTGLGLPIARTIARHLGGDLRWTEQRFRLTVDARARPGLDQLADRPGAVR